MRALIALLLLSGTALAQGPGGGPGPIPPNSQLIIGSSPVVGSGSGQWLYTTSFGVLGSFAVAGDCTMATVPNLICTTLNGVSPGTAFGLNQGTSVANPGTGKLEALFPIQTIIGASKTFGTADLFFETRRTNSGSAMTDTFPASSATGIANGTKITVTNADATASDTITAGAGTSFNGGTSTDAVGPGRSIQYAYDLSNTTWRRTLNTGSALLAPSSGGSVGSILVSAGTTTAWLADVTTGQVLTSGGATANPVYTSTLPTAVQGNITSLGTIGFGIWQGTAINGAYIATNTLAWTQGGTGAVQQNVTTTLSEDVRSTQFGFVCDGSTDNTTAFTNAINYAIATTGELRVLRDASNGYQCKWNSQIVIQAPDGPHNKIKITVDPDVQMLWNGGQGGLQFNGLGGNGVAGGRLIPWVDGGYWYPYSAGGGWMIEMFAAWTGRVTNVIYNQQGTTANRANVILMDGVFGGTVDKLAVYGCGTAILMRNATNGVDITNGDIENCSTDGIISSGNTINANTNATTPTSSNVLHFASPPFAFTGQTVADTTNPSFIPGGTTVLSTSGNTVTISANPTSTVGNGDTIQFVNSPSNTNKISNMYLEQLTNTIDVGEAGGSAWQISNVFINQGNFLTGGLYDIHLVGSAHTVDGVVAINSTSPTVIKNESTYSLFTNIVGYGDSGISDYFFRNHTAAAGTYFCGAYNGTINFYFDASTAQNNVVCGGALNNGVSAGMNIYSPPRTVTTSSTLTSTDSSVVCNGAGSITLTLPAASALSGKVIRIKTVANQTVVSASSNVVPINSVTAGTAILAATAGKWTDIQSDGTNWIAVAGN